MEYLADLHIHSRFARGTSPRINVDGLAVWAKKKGIKLLGTGDFTHPGWLEELKTHLDADGNDSGLYPYKGIYFVLATEVNTVYVKDKKVRKVHHCVLAPSFEVVEQVSDVLSRYGQLDTDGRPTLSMSSPELVEVLRSVSDMIEVYPAHIWTPWFGAFGSKSGFDSMEECYEDQTRYIHAFETGLSSDPPMNWRLSALDRYTVLSGSDAHSLENLGREATVFDLQTPSYRELIEKIRRKETVKTVEFYPEEGKYHYDGHRKCGIVLSPEEAKKLGNICPVCRRPLTLGVLHRVDDLADRPSGYVPENAAPFEHLIPLREIISQVYKTSKTSKKVQKMYDDLVTYFGNEYRVLHAKKDYLLQMVEPNLAEAIIRARSGLVNIRPGYDGVYGEVLVDLQRNGSTEDRRKIRRDNTQTTLYDFRP